MPILSGPQAQDLWKGLLAAYDLDEFRRFLFFALNKRLDHITLGASYATRVFDVIENAEREGWVPRLISAACDARPDNQELRALGAQVGLTAAPPGLATDSVAGRGLERIIRGSPFQDFGPWCVRLGELEGQVCRVEFPEGTAVGTGFLVGPDLVLTCYHVVEELVDGPVAPQEARLRFDYRRAASGVQVFEGTAFSLANDWLVASAPPSPADDMAHDLATLVGPAAEELDFALLRVRGAPGEQRAGFAARLPEVPARGWVRATQVGAAGFAARDTLFILQHPAGDPLKLAIGQSMGLNANQTRLRYQVSTDHGSSGSPCLNAGLELVGLHNVGDPSYNAAVPLAAIRAHLAGSAHLADRAAGRELFAD
jgi:hypothetical protein